MSGVIPLHLNESSTAEAIHKIINATTALSYFVSAQTGSVADSDLTSPVSSSPFSSRDNKLLHAVPVYNLNSREENYKALGFHSLLADSPTRERCSGNHFWLAV